MAKINFKKVLSFLMALCMIITLFTCAFVMPSSAANAYAIKFSYGNAKLDVRPTELDYSKGGHFTFTCKLKMAEGINYEHCISFKYYNTSSQLKNINSSNYTVSYDANTYTLTADFTTFPSDIRANSAGIANLLIRIGDVNGNYSGTAFQAWMTDFAILKDGQSSGAYFAYLKADNISCNDTPAADSKYTFPTGISDYKTKGYISVVDRGTLFDPIVPEEPVTGKMFHVNGKNTSNLKIGFRNNTFTSTDSKFVAGKEYRFTCKYKNTNPDIKLNSGMFWLWYYNTSDSDVRIDSANTDAVESYNKSTFEYTLTFTMPDDCRDYNNAYIYFADYNGNLSGYEAYFADFKLENLTDNTVVNMFPEITSSNVYTSDINPNNKWRVPVGWDSKVTIEDIGNTFDPVIIPFCGGDANDDGNVDICDLVCFKSIMTGNINTDPSFDANEDNKVDEIDLSIIIKILLNTGESAKLYNTYYKLNYAKSLNISYIGGSVTGGVGASTEENGWAFLVTKYLKQKYPNANITENNMGVGGTGSYLGMARFENNIIENKPDLLFIEFAINDMYDDIPEEQTKQNIEYMINSVYESNPYADIVFVLVTDKNVIGTEFKSYKAIKSVAEYYELPIVDVGQAMWEELNGSIDSWDEYYSDGVHPSDAGHKVYADTVFEKMEEIMINGGKFKYKLPEEAMCENGFTNVSLLTRDTFKPFQWGSLDDTVYGAAYWFDNDTYEKSGCPFRTSYARCFSKILPKYIYPKSNGATVEFTVNGNNIGILGTIKEGQSLTVTLDGKETITINGTSNVALTEYPLWNSLENTDHTVKIVANGDGPYIALAAVVVGS